MSIIAVQNIPMRMSLKELVKELKKPIRGNFEALNFANTTSKNKLKTCYIRLSEKVDPVHAVQNINNSHYKSKGKYYSYIPDEVPDIPFGGSGKLTAKRLRRCAPALRRQLRIAELNAGGKIIKVTSDEIVIELQAKYPGLYALSKKHGHKLLKEISKVTYERAKELIEGSPPLEESSFQATRAYRRAHPHSGDFQLVLSALHAIEEAAGLPKTELQESDINTAPPITHIFDLSKEKVQALCDKYSTKIQAQMSAHISKLNCEVTQLDTEEELAKKQVWQELKKLEPFLAIVTNQVICKHFIPPEGKDYRMRIYGEPTLPPKETLMPFLQRYKLKGLVARSKRTHNMMLFKVAPEAYSRLMAMNGTTLNGSKLIIASSDAMMFKLSQYSTDAGETNVNAAEDGDADGDADEDGDDGPNDSAQDDEQDDWEDEEMEL